MGGDWRHGWRGGAFTGPALTDRCRGRCGGSSFGSVLWGWALANAIGGGTVDVIGSYRTVTTGGDHSIHIITKTAVATVGRGLRGRQWLACCGC